MNLASVWKFSGFFSRPLATAMWLCFWQKTEVALLISAWIWWKIRLRLKRFIHLFYPKICSHHDLKCVFYLFTYTKMLLSKRDTKPFHQPLQHICWKDHLSSERNAFFTSDKTPLRSLFPRDVFFPRKKKLLLPHGSLLIRPSFGSLTLPFIRDLSGSLVVKTKGHFPLLNLQAQTN